MYATLFYSWVGYYMCNTLGVLSILCRCYNALGFILHAIMVGLHSTVQRARYKNSGGAASTLWSLQPGCESYRPCSKTQGKDQGHIVPAWKSDHYCQVRVKPKKKKKRKGVLGRKVCVMGSRGGSVSWGSPGKQAWVMFVRSLIAVL